MALTITVTDAKGRLSELVAAVATTRDEIEITRNGDPVAVLVSAEAVKSLRDTIAILSDSDAVAQIQEERPTSPPTGSLTPRTSEWRCSHGAGQPIVTVARTRPPPTS